MRINWRIRFKNGKWVAMFLGAVVTTGYMICETLGIKVSIPQTDVTKIIMAILGLLSMLGVITDPTTKGVSDSDLAMTYGRDNTKLHEDLITEGLKNAEVLEDGNSGTDR
ncbi:MAG: phage holin [[Eubacterium] sulci]|jgi:phi LC3 family holin|nr:phage holin [[Eubacterium] sulci]